MRVEAVLVDAGGVLVTPDPARIAAALAPFGLAVGADHCVRAHYAAVGELTRVTEGDSSVFRPYHHAFAVSCGADDDVLDAAVAALADEFSRPPMFTYVLPGAVEALRALCELDLQVAIVTNSGGYAEEMLRELGVCQAGAGPLPNVAMVVDSAVVGFEKPDPRIFEHTLDRLEVRADAAVHVGDTPAADVAGALAAGVTPVLIDPHDEHPNVTCTKVDHLADVVGIVR